MNGINTSREIGISPDRFYEFSAFCQMVPVTGKANIKALKKSVMQDENTTVWNRDHIFITGEIGIKHIALVTNEIRNLSKENSKDYQERKKPANE